MDRLRMLLTLTTASLFSLLSLQISAVAQDARVAVGEFVIAGDVVQPASYPLPQGQLLNLQQAVNAAGPASDAMMVMIVRPSQGDALWTHALSATNADPGPQIVSGDILVVYSTGSLTRPVQPNAVFMTSKATVLSLKATAGNSVRIGDVLAVSQLPPEAASMLRRSSMKLGRGRQSGLTSTDTVEHGDVLKLVMSSPNNEPRGRGFAPQVSEWSASAVTTSTTGQQSSATMPTSYTVPEVPQVATSTQQTADLPTPDSYANSNSGFNGAAVPEAAVPGAANEAFAGSDSDVVSQPSVEFQPADETLSKDSEDAVSLFRSAPATDTHPEEVEADFDRTLADEDMAPLPPEEVPVAQVEDAINLWNLIFVAGLLVAGGLIIAGWIKSEAELKQLEKSHSVPLYGFSESKPAPEVPAAPVIDEVLNLKSSLAPLDDLSSEPDFAPLSVDPTQTFTISGSSLPANTANNTPLVAPHEWRSRDWQDRNQPAAAAPPVREILPAAAVIPVESSKPVEPSQPVEQVTDVYNDLNDLIENRLPVELREAQLPLRINLFGKAAGPRRLRVDAAHTQLAGPHMNMSGERRRSDSTASMVSNQTSSSQIHGAHAPESEGAPGIRPQRGSLDRALNYLHEQGE